MEYRNRLFLKPDAFYTDAGCDLILGVAATKMMGTKSLIASYGSLAYSAGLEPCVELLPMNSV